MSNNFKVCVIFQVQVNLAKDVLKKVETNHEQHKQYEDNLHKGQAWIENAKEVIRRCSQASSNATREQLETRLVQIQVGNYIAFLYQNI